MLTLMKKNAYFFGLYLLGLVPLMTIWWFTSSGDLGLFKIIFQGQWLIILTIGCVGVSEQNESKNNGYIFLKTLPVSTREIVTAKFNVLFLATLFLGVYNVLLYRFTSGPAHFISLGRIYVLMSACLGLILGGLMYLVIYRFGQSGFARTAWSVVIILILSPVLFIEGVIPSKKPDIQGLADALPNLNPLIWIGFIIVTVTVYFSIMQISIKVKSARSS